MSDQETGKKEKQLAMARAQAVMKTHEEALLSKPNVVGVGVGLRQQGGVMGEELAVVVLVRRKVPAEQLAPEDLIPAQIEGVPVDVQEVGDITAY